MRSSMIGCALGCGHANGTRPIVFAVLCKTSNAKGFVLKHPTHSGNRASPPNEHSASSKSHRGHARPSHAVTTAPVGSAYVSSSVAQYIRVCFPERVSIARRRKRAHRPHRENGGADDIADDAAGSNLSSNRASTSRHSRRSARTSRRIARVRAPPPPRGPPLPSRSGPAVFQQRAASPATRARRRRRRTRRRARRPGR